jgi:hypothetical protein
MADKHEDIPLQCESARCMSAIDTTAVVEAARRLLDGD